MVRVEDLSSKRFGRWHVIKRLDNDGSGRSMWLCECTCGNSKAVPGKVLRNGSSQSCGCLRIELNSSSKLIDLTGRQFGEWTVICRYEETPAQRDQRHYRKSRWVCRCSCGTVKDVIGNNLKRNMSHSCGRCHDTSEKKGQEAEPELRPLKARNS